jgi:DNA polymerase-3 subunit epsilon
MSPLQTHGVRYAVLDVETTGLQPGASNIIEIAIIQLDARANVISEWSSLINPPGDGELGATHIHGISRAMVAGAPSIADFADEIVERIQGHIIVGHVVEFDLSHLMSEFARLGRRLPNIGSVSLCTRDLARRQLQPSPLTLRNCCDQLGISIHDAHSALGDTRATVELFRHLVTHCDPESITERQRNLAFLTWSLPMFANLRAAAQPRSLL